MNDKRKEKQIMDYLAVAIAREQYKEHLQRAAQDRLLRSIQTPRPSRWSVVEGQLRQWLGKMYRKVGGQAAIKQPILP